MRNDWHIQIGSSADIVTARQKGRELAMELGFDGSDLTIIATAISEVARNILAHATHGEITLTVTHRGNKNGICVTARDDGLGVADLNPARQNGIPTQNKMGAGLPGAKRLMDDFQIQSRVGKGTKVTMKKWLHCPDE